MIYAEAKENSIKNILYFDVTRAISAQLVVLGHALNIFLPGIFLPTNGSHPFYMQSFAVVIFFVLSGYLITSTVMRKWDTPGFGFGTYLIDRIARVVYPLLPATALIIAFDFLVFRGSTVLPFIAIDLGLPTLIAAFTLSYNHPLLQQAAIRIDGLPWLDAGPVGTAAPLWSIVAEWWIYVAFGVLVLVFARGRKLNPGWIILLVFSIAVPAGYFALGSAHAVAWIVGMIFAFAGPQLMRLPRQFHIGLFLISTATFLAALVHVANNLSTPLTILPAAVAFCAAYFAFATGTATGAAAGEGAGRRRAPSPLREKGARVIVFVSGYSYSLYLVHFSVTTYLWYAFHDDLRAWQLVSLSFLVSNVAGLAYWFLVERHFHRVARLMKPRSAQNRPLPAERERIGS
ncbi:acyltransferase family protein [Arthrobacter zhaoguopingii]|uniref:acyltransferase family protein n=1 Tax=Arthrobacter zhaoguopingii TaxID=2681491 RepID=UPI00135BC47C|nr:acyltransferase [Arthrobacter zhaoguopingii]